MKGHACAADLVTLRERLLARKPLKKSENVLKHESFPPETRGESGQPLSDTPKARADLVALHEDLLVRHVVRMDEDVLGPVARGDEAEALDVVEELHSAGAAHGRLGPFVPS